MHIFSFPLMPVQRQSEKRRLANEADALPSLAGAGARSLLHRLRLEPAFAASFLPARTSTALRRGRGKMDRLAIGGCRASNIFSGFGFTFAPCRSFIQAGTDRYEPDRHEGS
jgi:hypothetical protein